MSDRFYWQLRDNKSCVRAWMIEEDEKLLCVARSDDEHPVAFTREEWDGFLEFVEELWDSADIDGKDGDK